MTHVKICGLSDPKNLTAAIDTGARFIGFVFYPPSPRHVEINTAKELALMIPTGVRAVGLFVDPTDEQLTETLGKVQLDMIQLHGNETTQRITEIKERYKLDVMKAIAISGPEDLERLNEYETVADWLLCDTPSANHGGSGESFDWDIITKHEFTKPWMLAGGLTPENVGEALSRLSPNAVDVSSGVESARGIKDVAKIKAFIEAVKTL